MALSSTPGPLHERHDLVMLDLDGVVYVGPDAVPGASAALGAVDDAGTSIAYLTNNASRLATTVASHLRELSMPVPDDAAVVTSAQAVARLMAAELPAGARVLVVGGEGLRGPLQDVGLEVVDGLDDAPAAVVQGFHPDLGWSQLAEAAYAVQAGLPWYASNTDMTVPTPRGVAPGNGSLVQAVANATGARPVVAGKPERPLFDETLQRTGSTRPLMVGDRVDTDLDGATTLGIDTMAVLTGVTDLEELASLAPSRRPTYVAHDLRGLVDTHHEVTIDDTVATCGTARVELDGDAVVLASGDSQETDVVRAALALAWHTADAQGRTPTLRLGLGG